MFLIGSPPIFLIAGFVLIGAGVASVASRWLRGTDRRLAGQPAEVSATTDRPATVSER
jgi:hypothetical protein